MGMDLDEASNGIFLRVLDDQISPMSRHRGYYSAYSDFVKSKLDNIDLDLPPEKLQNEVLNEVITLHIAILSNQNLII
ncbi:AHH domain-containing protein [Streptococcus gordonii]|uniref:AHH domain-containing protein n=1 Tax=Streptococcus gordonii TaxID=1302 RepID=UPI001C8B0E2A|nr:AHH domain-containing protein [Streptococcus gordonii]